MISRFSVQSAAKLLIKFDGGKIKNFWFYIQLQYAMFLVEPKYQQFLLISGDTKTSIIHRIFARNSNIFKYSYTRENLGHILFFIICN